jgi:hypothetical protein
MKVLVHSLIAVGCGASIAAAQTASSGGATFSNSTNCKVMTLKSGESPPTGTILTPSGSLPTATAGRKGGTAGLEGTGRASTSSLPDGSKMVTDEGGGCTIYRNEERTPNPSR